LENSTRSLSLRELSESSGLSKYHFHRLLKKIVGVTPKQYHVNLRLNRFQRGLTRDQSITEAIYEAGYGSGSGAYSKHHDNLAMKPKSNEMGLRE
jgi:AraC family transcriptional regulator of adaptative response/methylated-DNA-[protein]-cysteine methyltransferase